MLDGAQVLYWAWSEGPPFFVMADGGEGIPIHGLAICRYEGSGAVCRFSCSDGWKVQNDSPYDQSVAAAMAGRSGQYDIARVRWRPYAAQA
jgi:hypothetical protein